jgi:hypothetical protein
MHVRRALALVGAAAAAAAFAACKEPPFAPRWDADMYMPLSTAAIHLDSRFGGVIPGNTSDTVSFPPQSQGVDGPIGDILKNLVTDPTRARTVLTLTVGKRTAAAATDTLFIASHSSGLRPTPQDTTIRFPLSLAASDTTKTDSITLSVAQITMLRQTVAQDCVPLFGPCSQPSQQLFVQLRGQVSNPSVSPIVVTSADSITVKLTVTARIAMVHK